MSEPYGKPNQQQIATLREKLRDSFLWWAVNDTIKSLNDLSVKKIEEHSFFDSWKSQTRKYIRKFGAGDVIEILCNQIELVADEQWVDGFPTWIFKEVKIKAEAPKEKTKFKGSIRKAVDSKLKITEVAIRYGIKVRNGKAICPFHDDKDPSLSLNDDKNVFYCFGCKTKGDIIEFIRLLEEKKNDN